MRNLFYVLGLAGLLFAAACTDPAHPIAVNSAASKPAAPAAPAEHAHSEEDDAPRISLADAKKAFDAGQAVIIDVRDEMAYKAEHIKGSLNIPTAQLDAKANTIPKGKKIIAYCS
jgi:3-mercaptopyruvate sulfurtransferase SseA